MVWRGLEIWVWKMCRNPEYDPDVFCVSFHLSNITSQTLTETLERPSDSTLWLCCLGIRSKLPLELISSEPARDLWPQTKHEIFVIKPSASPSSNQTRAEMKDSETKKGETKFPGENVCLKMSDFFKWFKILIYATLVYL